MKNYAVVNLEPIVRALAEAVSVREVKEVLDKAEAVEAYLKRTKDSEEIQLQAGVLKVRCQRRLGELLKETVSHKGGGDRKSPSSKSRVIGDLPEGVTWNQSSTWQRIAEIPAPKFEEEIRAIEEGHKEAPAAHIKRVATVYAREKKKKEERQQELKEVEEERQSNGSPPGERPKAAWEIRQGDVLEVLAGLADGCVHLAFADPPYNIGIDYGQGKEADERPPEEFHGWCQKWMEQVFRVLKPTGSFWVLINDENAAEFKLMLQKVGFTVRRWIKWYETFGNNCTNNFNRTSRHLFYCVKNPKRFTFNREAVSRPSDRQEKYDDKRANPEGKIWDDVWGVNPEIPRLNASTNERELGFLTQLPLGLLLPIVGCASDSGQLVLDPFSSSGTTGEAALRLGRRYLGIELNEDYVARSRERLRVVEYQLLKEGTNG